MATASPRDGAEGVGVGAGVGVADGREGAGVGEVEGSFGATGPADDCEGAVEEVDDVVEVDADEAAPLVLVAASVLSAPCEKVPRLRLWSRSSSSA
jgi:hypothetical protein